MIGIAGIHYIMVAMVSKLKISLLLPVNSVEGCTA